MLKKYFAGLTFLFSSLNGAPVGNTASPELIHQGIILSPKYSLNFRAGYEADLVTDGRMNQYQESGGRVDRYRQNTNSGTTILNILDQIDIYGLFGSSGTRADWRITDQTGDVHRYKIKTHHAFLWAVGSRAIVYESNRFVFGLGGRYSYSNYRPCWFTMDGSRVTVNGTHFVWSDWQANLDVAYKIKLFTPYLGVKYSHARTRLGNFSVPISSNGSGSNHFKNRVPVGVYVGCAITNGDYLMLNLEARLTDEEAATISVDVRF